jgi:hypothetical protein
VRYCEGEGTVKITTWNKSERAQMADMIRRGQPIHLTMDAASHRGHRAQRNIRIDEVAPLCDSIHIADQRLSAAASAYLAPKSKGGAKATVTAVIPTNRGCPAGIKALLSQDVDVDILVVSNGAGPDHVEGARVLRMDWDGHGSIRARALNHVSSDYVFFTVDDAIPLGGGCIRQLIEVLDGGGWDAAVARQIPWPDADAVTAARLRRWTPPGHHVVQMAQADHVATLYKTSTLKQFPIPIRPIAEDAWWSLGRRVAYVPTSPVLHSHAREPRSLYARNRDIHKELIAMGHAPLIPHLGAALAALPGVVRPSLACGPLEFVNQLAEIAGQWRGAVNAR